ncbi:Arginine biosynthesis bifunctional protein ArgJ [Crateriforma conspicua]|nr:Arginine biosynthesis bifunctional protein ArgJ [Crateriforma conspicua]
MVPAGQEITTPCPTKCHCAEISLCLARLSIHFSTAESPVTEPLPHCQAAETLADDQLPAGFRFGSTACGIKPSGRPDLSVILADRDAVAAGVYTRNQVVAAPVTWCRGLTPTDRFRAVVTNSGNANACTGPQGEQDTAQMAAEVAQRIDCEDRQVLVMSTGVIGHTLPMDKVVTGIDAAVAGADHSASAFRDVATAFCTTDQYTKMHCTTAKLSAGTVKIAAIAKGAGMIQPDMATLLSVVVTDAALPIAAAQKAIADAAAASLNRISVDGHMSTNDTLLLLARNEGTVCSDAEDLSVLTDGIAEALIDLGKMIVADGEGATHVLCLQVDGASDDASADVIARAVGNSPLVKTAIKGNDPNWGRIVSAAGYAGPKIDVAKTSLSIDGVAIYESGAPVSFDAATLSGSMKSASDVHIHLTVGDGPGQSRFWASDLTEAYVSFNSEYTT